jgi:hypothetical protein
VLVGSILSGVAASVFLIAAARADRSRREWNAKDNIHRIEG